MQLTEKEDEYSSLLEILGLDDSANDDDIRRRYRELVKEYHPDGSLEMDVDIGGEISFNDIKKAYDRILDIRSHRFGGRR